MDVADMLTERMARENGDFDVQPPVVVNEVSPVRNVETRIGLIQSETGWRELRIREQNGKAVLR